MALCQTLVRDMKMTLRVIFDQWLKLHLGLDALSNPKNLKRMELTSAFLYAMISTTIVSLFLSKAFIVWKKKNGVHSN